MAAARIPSVHKINRPDHRVISRIQGCRHYMPAVSGTEGCAQQQGGRMQGQHRKSVRGMQHSSLSRERASRPGESPRARRRFGQREHQVCLRGCAPLGSSVADAERGAVLGPACTPVVEAGGADVGVAEPVLDASDVGVVLEGVGGGGGPEGVDDALHGNGGRRGVLPDELVDAVACERPAGPAGLGRLEQGCVPVAAVGCELEVIAQGRERGRVDRHGPGLRALAADPDADPTLAVIVAVPLPATVTRPDASTVATELALLVQVTVAPAMTLAFWSRTSALN